VVELIPVKMPRFDSRFDIFSILESYLQHIIKTGDIIVISSKFVAISEGSFLNLERIKPSNEASLLASKFKISKKFSEVIQRESDEILGGVQGFLLCVKSGMLCPNAGVDKSNIRKGNVVIYPREPGILSSLIRYEMKFRLGVDIGVILADSRLMPMRKGTIGVALSCAGIDGLIEMRGRRDLFGNILRVTVQALADDLCSAAQPLMGESDESTPVVVVRGLENSLSDVFYEPEDFGIDRNQCVYMRSLRQDIFFKKQEKGV